MAMRIGVDIGGTFTDFVIYNPLSGRLDTFKLLSTPANPAEAVLEGLRLIAAGQPGKAAMHVIHGSTVATNALLERKGARTALITTRGFRDVLQIGRQNRPSLYDFTVGPPEPLAPAELRLEVDERVGPDGQVIAPLDPVQTSALAAELKNLHAESIAVCLLFSFLHPEHEQVIAQTLRSAGFPVSASHEILPEYREYERMSTTTVNAYVSPALDRYLASLEKAAVHQGDLQVRVMQSNGGHISLDEARRNGVRCILSGPAGGIVGSLQIGLNVQSVNNKESRLQVLTFDMGGTSTDVSLIDGAPRITTESMVSGCPIRIPVLDIHTIGAGGGSIASVDLGGALRVGPQSAGADPGPACYGRGDAQTALPTVTDANLVLGRLVPELFLGGKMPLDTGRAHTALARLGEQLGLDPASAAWGVTEVVNAHMERALRVISVERGYDPRQFGLLSFGGAGGLHAADLARRLSIPTVIVPPIASTLSAFGMLCADVVKDYTQTVMLRCRSGEDALVLPALEQALGPLAARGQHDLESEGISGPNILLERALDMRYAGQSYELIVPWFDASQNPFQAFHDMHQQAYGYARPDSLVEIVNVRLRAIGRVTPPLLKPESIGPADPRPALLEFRPVALPADVGKPGKLSFIEVPFYRFELLRPGNRMHGPAVVIRADTTIWIGAEDEGLVDEYQNIIIKVGN